MNVLIKVYFHEAFSVALVQQLKYILRDFSFYFEIKAAIL